MSGKVSLWKAFASTWNATIQRRPQNVIGSFMASQTVTVFALFGGITATGIRFPAEIAVPTMIEHSLLSAPLHA